MNAAELRKKFIDFFVSKGHVEIKSAPLVPENDPTVLFTTAGMHPLVPYLLGMPHPAGKRLVDYQKCVRTNDIEEVGDNVHLTFFEMLGNWSIGDYFKETAIKNSFEFLTSSEWLGIPLSKLAFTVFKGDNDAPFDQEAYDLWTSLGVSPNRIAKLPKEDNWWGPAGTTGPCGPDTEMFYWSGEGPAPEVFDPNDKNWVEIWNDVFMQYNKKEDGTFEKLAHPNIDTGMGFERVVAVLEGKKTCYDTELFQPIFDVLFQMENKPLTAEKTRSERIIADHVRTATFIMAEGITPGNKDQQYLLRRIVRRMLGEGHKLNLPAGFMLPLAEKVIDFYHAHYPELEQNRAAILAAFEAEEKDFSRILIKGIQMFEKAIANPQNIQNGVLSGAVVFDLSQTYGYPKEMTVAMAKEKGLDVDMAGYEAAFKHHQDLSRGESAPCGLADHKEETTALHTATHLLHQALRQVLGTHVEQRGSHITAERLRFDFSHPEKVSPEDLKKVEDIVNKVIQEDLPVVCEEMSLDDAKKTSAIGLFANKYGDRVTVYSIGNFSKEICAGPHVTHTGVLKSFRIMKEESSSKGVRRIKATIGFVENK
ncbi:MAG: alanine--tRNA ligase [Alphaproteobacteria bacterium]|nr:alanine--tRNA ligase [Alphaproteobacteria bacterium]